MKPSLAVVGFVSLFAGFACWLVGLDADHGPLVILTYVGAAMAAAGAAAGLAAGLLHWRKGAYACACAAGIVGIYWWGSRDCYTHRVDERAGGAR